MKIERTMTYDIPPDEAVAMSCDPAFQERKCQDAGALSWSVRVTPLDDGSTEISTRRKLPTVGFPSLLRKLLPEGMTSTELITWAPAEDSVGARSATLAVDFHGAPTSLKGRIDVVPTATGGSSIRITADFKASVPLVGGKVEKLASPIIVDIIDSEQRTGAAWSAEAA
ncbi:DUF2505 domain-containing protein [uncultured Jatrophihabitans sp.]|uniref:DUF2505 domain-containing protein n=1 Tax=uncultured Jatrophihabitans sp. TaxID=1610747 RepID=UPI0035CBD82B